MYVEQYIDGDVNVYVEGLLVQTRDPKEVIKWSEDFGMRELAEEMNRSFYKNCQGSDKPWAHHFKNMDGYVIIKTIYHPPSKKSSTSIVVSLNERNHNVPTLQVVSNATHNNFSVEGVAALAALARYYALDEIVLGDNSGVPDKGDDGSSG
jgi:hypothetical protein